MAQLTIQQISRNGLEASFAAAAGGGDKVLIDPRVFVWVKNDDAADKTLTFDVQSTVDGLAVADRTVVVTAGEERLIGPFTESYADADGNLNISYSAVTDVTIAAIKL